MNGRLRLDKLQELIEKYLLESRPPKSDVNSVKDNIQTDPSLKRDCSRSTLPGINKTLVETGTVSLPPSDKISGKECSTCASAMSVLDKDRNGQLGPFMPIYVKTPTLSKKASVEAELENAVPLSDIISSGRFESVSQTELDDGTQRFLVDSEDSTINQAPSVKSINKAWKLLMHRSISLPISAPLSIKPRANSYDDRIQERFENSLSKETCSSDSTVQATGECAIESEPVGSRKPTLVNRDAIEFSSGSHRKTLVADERFAENPELSGQGLLASVLEQQSMRTVPVIQSNDLMILERLSTGRISSIYRGVWMSRSQRHSPYQVALKVATMTDASTRIHLDELRREADIASQLQHDNLCELKGICHSAE